ncbi:MAG TPA: NAD-dependent epimerase/dehydratase family protein [Bacteroidia bacterium]|nr:NAD-dependent epimerase/dehydratase family protein [Bacteroidia bacterium]
MKVLLLGASGFAGRNISKHLEQNPEVQLVLSSRSEGCNLLDMSQCTELIVQTKPDFIINCAAHVGSLNYVTQQAASVLLDNARMNMNLYEAVAASSPGSVIINPLANCAYPAQSDTFVEDQWLNGALHRTVLSYGSTKRFLWHTGESFYMQHGIKSIYLFVPNMYGPNDSTDPNKAHALDALISKFVKAEREGKDRIEIWGTGIAIREWLYAPDFARVLELIVSKKVSVGLDEPLNIGQNFGLSVRELVQIIHRHFGNRFKIEWNHNMPDGSPKKVMDERRFKKVFRDFKFTPLEEGITNTIKYYRSIYPY